MSLDSVSLAMMKLSMGLRDLFFAWVTSGTEGRVIGLNDQCVWLCASTLAWAGEFVASLTAAPQSVTRTIAPNQMVIKPVFKSDAPVELRALTAGPVACSEGLIKRNHIKPLVKARRLCLSSAGGTLMIHSNCQILTQIGALAAPLVWTKSSGFDKWLISPLWSPWISLGLKSVGQFVITK